MPTDFLKYTDNHFIKSDLKRLKKWRSLEQDIKAYFAMLNGKLTDDLLKSVFCFPMSNHITEVLINGEVINFYKMNIKISNPEISSVSGGRLVFGIVNSSKDFIPILLYIAKEEKTFYPINGKKYPLKREGLIKIIDEKLKIL